MKWKYRDNHERLRARTLGPRIAQERFHITRQGILLIILAALVLWAYRPITDNYIVPMAVQNETH